MEPEEEYILVIDADMIMRAPFLPEELGVAPGWAVSAYFGYLKGVYNELALKHVPHVAPRNDTRAGPVGRRGDQVWAAATLCLHSDGRRSACQGLHSESRHSAYQSLHLDSQLSACQGLHSEGRQALCLPGPAFGEPIVILQHRNGGENAMCSCRWAASA